MRKIFFSFLLISNLAFSQDLLKKVEHHFADNNGVKIHYVTLGSGPLIIMLHGFPDYWYTWRNQMIGLSKNYTIAAIDLRGYNKSDKPEGEENYSMKYLIQDVISVIKNIGFDKAIIIGHDWGGAIAWQIAMNAPQFVNKLIILSTPHPLGLFREFSNNREQQKNSKYAEDYQKENADKELTPESLASWVNDEAAKPCYIEAFKNSSIKAMLNYYKASFPKKAENKNVKPTAVTTNRKQKLVECPTLAIFGKKDKALLPAGWNSTWDWINNNFTLVSIPDAGHFILQDADDYIMKIIIAWLKYN